MKNTTLTTLETEGYEGIDANLGISLFEYGLIWKLNNGIYTFIYGVGVDNKGNFNNFDCGSFEEKLNFKENFNWAEFEEVESNIGEKLENLSLPEKIKALVDCYGYLCVFGSAYYPFQIVDEDSET